MVFTQLPLLLNSVDGPGSWAGEGPRNRTRNKEVALTTEGMTGVPLASPFEASSCQGLRPNTCLSERAEKISGLTRQRGGRTRVKWKSLAAPGLGAAALSERSPEEGKEKHTALQSHPSTKRRRSGRKSKRAPEPESQCVLHCVKSQPSRVLCRDRKASSADHSVHRGGEQKRSASSQGGVTAA